MPKFKVPCSWEVSGYVIVNTETIDDAIDRCDDVFAEMVALPTESDYISGSFKFDHEGQPDLIETVKDSQTPSAIMLNIPSDIFKELTADAAKLAALEAAGVDNWDGYDDAMSMIEDI